MKSVRIAEYQSDWPDEYSVLAKHLRSTECDNILRIDHIGSTSVAGLAAKDVIDVQVTVRDLGSHTHLEAFRALGLQQRVHIVGDLFVGLDTSSSELAKQYFREPDGWRRAHIHIREQGRLNQRYALLFRDYLRSDADVRSSYELVKRRLAKMYPEDNEGYLSIKDPIMDIVYKGAENWAAATNWLPSLEHE